MILSRTSSIFLQKKKKFVELCDSVEVFARFQLNLRKINLRKEHTNVISIHIVQLNHPHDIVNNMNYFKALYSKPHLLLSSLGINMAVFSEISTAPELPFFEKTWSLTERLHLRSVFKRAIFVINRKYEFGYWKSRSRYEFAIGKKINFIFSQFYFFSENSKTWAAGL
jgi:hypothetical protein